MLQTFETEYGRWQRLFLFCLGIAAAAAFCMKWLEEDFIGPDNQLFSILGMELYYPAEKINAITAGMKEPARLALNYHLTFDFVFMTGIFPGILALCMMGRMKSRSPLWRNVLLVLAVLQLVAWGCDVTENKYIFGFLETPVTAEELGFYHVIVMAKWVIAAGGFLVALPFALRRRLSTVTR